MSRKDGDGLDDPDDLAFGSVVETEIFAKLAGCTRKTT